jgi:hypothetical protein
MCVRCTRGGVPPPACTPPCDTQPDPAPRIRTVGRDPRSDQGSIGWRYERKEGHARDTTAVPPRGPSPRVRMRRTTGGGDGSSAAPASGWSPSSGSCRADLTEGRRRHPHRTRDVPGTPSRWLERGPNGMRQAERGRSPEPRRTGLTGVMAGRPTPCASPAFRAREHEATVRSAPLPWREVAPRDIPVTRGRGTTGSTLATALACSHRRRLGSGLHP